MQIIDPVRPVSVVLSVLHVISMKKIGWGILGPRAIAKQFAHCLALLDDAFIAAVGSRSLERSQAFCAEFGGRAYGSYEEMCADPDVDIVYVATPHPFHEPHIVKTLML